jgi:CHAT domain-containing protein
MKFPLSKLDRCSVPNLKISMKLKISISRVVAIACLCVTLATSSIFWYGDLAAATRPASVLSLLNTRPKPQPLNGQNLQRSLDRNDPVDVIRQVELGWQYQYEAYYQGKLKSQYLELPEIQQQLAKLDSRSVRVGDSLPLGTASARAERLRQRHTRTKSALLYAIPRPNGLHLILVSAQGSPVIRTVNEANAKTLPEVSKTLRLNIVNPQTISAEYLPPAQQLDRWLIQPVAADLKAQKIDTILFCLGTGLRGLPLAALHDGRQFLVERYNLGIIPAFNLLDRRSQSLPGSQVLAMGAAKFSDNDNLPAVPLELETITQKGFWPGRVLLNEAFTLARFRQARSRIPYEIVHLATHADISAKSVKDSYIQFWDRRLQLDEVRNLRLDEPAVQLLVLSACRTALGTPNAELGFAGLAVQSGAKAVLASLWAVDDVGTLVLMSDFYQQLKTAPLKSNALRSTQLAMLKGILTFKNSKISSRSRGSLPSELQPLVDRDLSHPYYWAAFTTIGNPW